MFILSSVTFGAENRIDLDLRLEPKNEKNFYLLKESFINKKVILFEGNTYKIVRSQNELFVDEYYDTVLQSLFKKKASLRYRKRFIDSVVSKNLIQFKTQKENSELIGMNEFKIEINLDETIVSYRDFKNYINRAKNQNSELYKQLRSYVNISKLEPIFSVTQYRDRFYLQDNDGKTIFTISFDEVLYSKELLKKAYFVIEFETNETIMASSDKINSDALVKSLNEFVLNLDEGNILFNRTYDSKYAVGIEKLGIKEIISHDGGIEFYGDLADIYKINQASRHGMHLYWEIVKLPFNEKNLYKDIYNINWDKYWGSLKTGKNTIERRIGP